MGQAVDSSAAKASYHYGGNHLGGGGELLLMGADSESHSQHAC